MFDIPVALIVFKRKDTLDRIIGRIREVKPKKLYILADAGRNPEEQKMVEEVRTFIEEQVDWDCELIKRYADENLGVYRNIGEGAKWVFSREEKAIFLEDDNLPDISFFQYCKEMLERYENDSRVFWVCGTNYLGEYNPPGGYSYMFTKHLLPCGWASWSDKFLKYYDGELSLLNDDRLNDIKLSYHDPLLAAQEIDVIRKTKTLLNDNINRASWDRQVIFSVRVNGMYGISPKVNLIENIGVDELSTHGGNSTNKTMTARFCEIPTKQLEFPLSHPETVSAEFQYEKLIGNTIRYPWPRSIALLAFRSIKPLLGLKRDESFVLKYGHLWKNKIVLSRQTSGFNSLQQLTTYFLVWLAITTSGYALSSKPGTLFHFALLIPILLYSLNMLRVKSISRHSVVSMGTGLWFVLILSSLLSCLLNPSMANFSASIKFWIMLTFALVFTANVSVRRVAPVFIYVMAIVCASSLMAYVATNFFGISLPLPEFTNINGVQYKSGYLFFVYNNHMAFRNMGAFWEPGIFATYITFAALILVKFRDVKYRKTIFALFFLALITTISTAAFLFMALIAAFYVTDKFKGALSQLLLCYAGILVFLLLVLWIDSIKEALVMLFPQVFSKLTNSDSASVSERLSSPENNIKLFLQSPFFGHGMTDSLTKYMQLTKAAQTSTSTYFLSAFGAAGIFYSIAWLVGVFKLNQPLMIKVLLLIFVISFLNKEPHYFFTITYIALFYLLKNTTRAGRC